MDMRIFKHWIRERRTGLLFGDPIGGVVFGGSDTSAEAARLDLDRRWSNVLSGEARGVAAHGAGYEADIREELLERLGAGAAITRNRYGAEILNCEGDVFVDVDWHPVTWWEVLIGRRKIDSAERLRRMLPFLHSIARKGTAGIRGIRVYETPRGMRLVLECGERAARSPVVAAAMEAVRSDHLYSTLCQKQNCFRARLTAKPSRLGMRSLNQGWPLDAAGLVVREQWVREYRGQAGKHAACRYVETLGHLATTATIELHDDRSGALTSLPLA